MDILYLILFIIGCFLLSSAEKVVRLNFIKWLFIIPFCLLVANRSVRVPDTDVYMSYFLLEDPSFLFYNDYGYELGFQTLTKMFKFLVGENYTLYFGLIILTNLLIIDFALTRICKIYYLDQHDLLSSNDLGKSIKENVYSVLPLTLYVAFFGLYFNAIVLRVGIALSLLLLTSSFAIKPNKRVSDYLLIILLLVLSYFFHATAVLGVLVILIILFSKRLSKKTYIWIFSIIGVIYFLNLTSRLGGSVFAFISSLNALTMFSSKLTGYEGDSYSKIFFSEGISMKFIFYWFMSFVLILNRSPSKIYYKYLHVYLAGLAVFALFRSVLFVERVTDFFLLFSFVLFFLFLLKQVNVKFWAYFIAIVLIQLVFVLRITNAELI